MGYLAYGVTADGERVPLSVEAKTSTTGLVVPSVIVDGRAFERVEVQSFPDEPEPCKWRRGEMRGAGVTAEMTARARAVLSDEGIALPSCAEVGRFTRTQIEAGDLERADRDADARVEGIVRRALEAALGEAREELTTP